MRIKAIIDVDDFILISRSGQQDSGERDYRTRYQKISYRFTRKFPDQKPGGFILVAVASDARPQRNRASLITAMPLDVRRRLRPAVSGSVKFGLRPWFGLRPVECGNCLDLAS